MDVTETITLDGGGDPNVIFVFKKDSDLGIVGGAHAVGNFLAGTAATIGASSITRGAILSRGSLTMEINAQIIQK